MKRPLFRGASIPWSLRRATPRPSVIPTIGPASAAGVPNKSSMTQGVARPKRRDVRPRRTNHGWHCRLRGSRVAGGSPSVVRAEQLGITECVDVWMSRRSSNLAIFVTNVVTSAGIAHASPWNNLAPKGQNLRKCQSMRCVATELD
jgi:hypothetical protein